jgi:hypothetical protein
VVHHLQGSIRPVGKADKERIFFAILEISCHFLLKIGHAIRIVFGGKFFELRYNRLLIDRSKDGSEKKIGGNQGQERTGNEQSGIPEGKVETT